MENNTNAANCLLLLYAFNTAKNVKRTRYADVAVQLYYIYIGCVYCKYRRQIIISIYFKIVLLDLEKRKWLV